MRGEGQGLGAIEGEIGIVGELAGVGAVLREAGDAEGGAERHRELSARSVLDRHGGGCRRLETRDHGVEPASGAEGEERGELVPAHPGEAGLGAHRRRETLTDRAQRRVAGRVPMRVVHLLEPVEVDRDHRRACAHGSGALEPAGEPLREGSPVR
jgi:hypothetical protein